MINNLHNEVIRFAQDLIRIQSYSGREKQLAHFIAEKMRNLGFEEVTIDRLGSVLGRIGNGEKSLLFESHMDTVKVNDEQEWKYPPFSGLIKDGHLWGRGAVDMKSAITASVYAAVEAKNRGFLDGKSVYVSCSVFEEDCDGEGVRAMLEDGLLAPDFAVICEPSCNQIIQGHNGKAQIVVRTHGKSAHGSAPEKGINAVYEMAEIIQRVEAVNNRLKLFAGRKGTLVLSQISSNSVSLNAVPDLCEIYLDRRLVPGETMADIEAEMKEITAGKNAEWIIDTVHRTGWTGAQITYHPRHDPWGIKLSHPLSQSAVSAYQKVFEKHPSDFGFWDFSTNAVALVERGIPCIGFGPGDPKLAHMRDEHCAVTQIISAFEFYRQLIKEI